MLVLGTRLVAGLNVSPRRARRKGPDLFRLSDFETERTASMLYATMGKIIRANEKAGVIFIAESGTQGAGVRFKKPKA